MPFDNARFDYDDSVLHNLIGARALIADRDRWVQDHRRAVINGVMRRCALGALDTIMGENADTTEEVRLLSVFAGTVPETMASADYHARRVMFTNDKLGYTATLRMFGRAIEARRMAMEATHAV